MLTDRSQRTSSTTGNITVGDYVEVNSDLSPGKKSYGGFGFITKDNKNMTYTVKYSGTESGRTESSVLINRITVRSLDTSLRRQERRSPVKIPPPPPSEKKR